MASTSEDDDSLHAENAYSDEDIERLFAQPTSAASVNGASSCGTTNPVPDSVSHSVAPPIPNRKLITISVPEQLTFDPRFRQLAGLPPTASTDSNLSANVEVNRPSLGPSTLSSIQSNASIAANPVEVNRPSLGPSTLSGLQSNASNSAEVNRPSLGPSTPSDLQPNTAITSNSEAVEEDDRPFLGPIKRKCARQTPPLQEFTPVAVSNRFDALSDTSMHASSMRQDVSSTPSAFHRTRKDSTSSTLPRIQPKSAIPPIFLKNLSQWSSKSKEIKSACEFPPICHTTGAQIRIQASTSSDFRALVRLFSANKWEYFTYQLPEDMKPFLLLRGLLVDTTTEEIKSSLANHSLYPDEIIQLRTTRPTRREQEHRNRQLAENPTAVLPTPPTRLLPLFQVKLSDPNDRARYESITHLCDLGVTFETFKPSPGPPQCKNCQRFGHTHKSCGLATRCVRCGDLHSHRECTVHKPDPATCANCKQNHPANYRQCPAYVSYAERLQSSRRSAVLPAAPAIDSTSVFPSLTTSAPPPPAPAPQPATIQETINSLFTPSVKSKLFSWLSQLIKKLIAPSEKPKTDILLEEIIQGALLLISDG
ncbi:uncharacterized protein LOC124165921 [Ischnura elegans]|uniref:uncharacterized protein LOC124165921 n=1 Tax=Ischnura elegans TaxID=197161 RepID=UPI001ED89917|nr:uncharacterized protein LOC124165921 [Ischnura elegans]